MEGNQIIMLTNGMKINLDDPMGIINLTPSEFRELKDIKDKLNKINLVMFVHMNVEGVGGCQIRFNDAEERN